MPDPSGDLLRRLVDTVVAGPGTLDVTVRQALAHAGDVPDALAPYAGLVSDRASQVMDGDVDALRQHGLSEDQIFEATVSLAIGAGWRRYEAGLRALKGAL